jgi:prolipoprotein diacylglyceryl transferase
MQEYFIWNANPVLLELGSLQIYWYGLLFAGSFFIGSQILAWIYKREGKGTENIDTLFFYVIVGSVVGARLVHCFFYEPSYFLANPMEIVAVWKGGLASHGGVIGFLITVWIYSKRYKESYTWLLSRLAIPAALTGSAIRFGNFMNSEIVGTPTDLPWAIVFQRLDNIPRHPTQLYESAIYLIIFLFLLTVYKRVKPHFATKILPALFFLTIFTARFFLEFIKTKQAAYETGLLSTGQMLSIPFILLGSALLIWTFISNKKMI